jgi:hypothetical protein
MYSENQKLTLLNSKVIVKPRKLDKLNTYCVVFSYQIYHTRSFCQF